MNVCRGFSNMANRTHKQVLLMRYKILFEGTPLTCVLQTLAQKWQNAEARLRGRRAPTALSPASPHLLINLTCPHCNKENLVAVSRPPENGNEAAREVECAHCKKTWDAQLPGPVMSGPFPR